MYQGIQVLLAMFVFLLSSSSNAVDEPVLPMFLVSPVIKAPAVIYAGQTVTLSYRITNNSPNPLKNTGLVNPPFGLTQISDKGFCSNPFNLAPGESCLLKLQISADKLRTNLVGGPLICSTPGNPLYCAGPSVGNEFNTIKDSNPPPSKVLLAVESDGHEIFYPKRAQTVAYGAAQTFTVTANIGYTLDPKVEGNCTIGYWSGSNYTTGAITYPCTLKFKAKINSYAVSTDGENLKVNPSTTMVAYNNSQTFLVTSNANFNLSKKVAGNCPSGTWKKNSYTTGPITIPCTLIFEAVAMTIPSAPNNLIVKAENSAVALNWSIPFSDGGSKITGYTASSTPGNFSCTTTGETACKISKLMNGQSYTFSVKATNAIGVGPESFPSAPATPANSPDAPGNLTAVATNSAVLLNWTEPSNDGGAKITGYSITPYIGSSPQKTITVKGANLTTTIKGLKNGTVYTFTVAAINAIGTGKTSSHSNPVTPNEAQSSALDLTSPFKISVIEETPKDECKPNNKFP